MPIPRVFRRRSGAAVLNFSLNRGKVRQRRRMGAFERRAQSLPRGAPVFVRSRAAAEPLDRPVGRAREVDNPAIAGLEIAQAGDRAAGRGGDGPVGPAEGSDVERFSRSVKKQRSRLAAAMRAGFQIGLDGVPRALQDRQRPVPQNRVHAFDPNLHDIASPGAPIGSREAEDFRRREADNPAERDRGDVPLPTPGRALEIRGRERRGIEQSQDRVQVALGGVERCSGERIGHAGIRPRAR